MLVLCSVAEQQSHAIPASLLHIKTHIWEVFPQPQHLVLLLDEGMVERLGSCL